MPKKTIVVVGVTGLQGSNVASHFHSIGWHVRGLTRDPSSASARDITARLPGIELVRGDADQKETLKAAFRGAHVVFAMTQFWDGFVPRSDDTDGYAAVQLAGEIETRRGKNMADAAKEVSEEDGSVLERYIWSTLPGISKISGGKWTTGEPYDAKARVDDYIVAKLHALAAKTSFIALAIYSNLPMLSALRAGGLRLAADGSAIQVAVHPVDVKHYFINVKETGKFVEALSNGRPGVKLAANNGEMSIPGLMSIITSITGIPHQVVPLTVEELDTAIPGGYGRILGTAGTFTAEFGFGPDYILDAREVDPSIFISTIEESLQDEDWTPLHDTFKRAREALKAKSE